MVARVRVVDFGVAKATDSLDPAGEPVAYATASLAGELEAVGLTLTGQLLGTPTYMAPEQFLGASVDAPTDVFAFCVVLYEALAGRRPFAGDDTASVSFLVLQGGVRPLEVSDVPAALSALVWQGLSRGADERPPALDRFVDALEAAATPQRSRQARVAAWWAAASLVALTTAGWVAHPGGGSGEPPASAPAVPVVVAVAPVETPSLDPPAEAAFTRLLAATDDDERLAAAAAFLESFGEATSELRRAIAHSAAGDVQWRRSCADPVDGLCIETLPLVVAATDCEAPRRGSILQRQRLAVLVEPAQRHLRAAVALAGVTVPEQVDQATRLAFNGAIGRARVQLADDELEDDLALETPPISTSRAAGRSRPPRSCCSSTSSRARAAAWWPTTRRSRRRATTMARNVYGYCVGKAEQHGLTGEPIVAFCRERLERFTEPAAE